eukprot:GILI01011138.1.p1 GENE.GILI01011138.1~~GILI01011138.1.p1  ORF type:complete len:980 (+),score=45.12 GILI01011138.1:106-2940(+)
MFMAGTHVMLKDLTTNQILIISKFESCGQFACLLSVERCHIEASHPNVSAILFSEKTTSGTGALILLVENRLISIRKPPFLIYSSASLANVTISFIGNAMFASPLASNPTACIHKLDSGSISGLRSFELWGNFLDPVTCPLGLSLDFVGEYGSEPSTNITIVQNTFQDANVTLSRGPNLGVGFYVYRVWACNDVGATPERGSSLSRTIKSFTELGCSKGSAVERCSEASMPTLYSLDTPRSVAVTRGAIGPASGLDKDPRFPGAVTSYIEPCTVAGTQWFYSPSTSSTQSLSPSARSSSASTSYSLSLSTSLTVTPNTNSRTPRTASVSLSTINTKTYSSVASMSHSQPITDTLSATRTEHKTSTEDICTTTLAVTKQSGSLTLTKIIPINLKPVPAIVSNSQQTSEVTSVVVSVSSLAGGVTAGGQLGVLNAITRLGSCVESDDGNLLPILVHPLRFSFGSGTSDYSAAVISNCIIIPLAITFVVLGPLQMILRMVKGLKSRQAALSEIGWPSLLVMPFGTLAEGIGVAVVMSGRKGKTLGIAIGLLGAVITAVFTGSWVWILFSVIPRRKLMLEKRPEKDKLYLFGDDSAADLERINNYRGVKCFKGMTLSWFVKPTLRWYPSYTASAERPLSAAFAESYLNAVGDKRIFVAELCSFLCSLTVGLIEGIPARHCKGRAVAALIAATLQCLFNVLTLVPLEFGLQVLLSLCVVPLTFIVTLKVFNGGGDASSSSFDDMIEESMASLSMAGNIIGIALMAMGLMRGFIEMVTSYRRMIPSNGLSPADDDKNSIKNNSFVGGYYVNDEPLLVAQDLRGDSFAISSSTSAPRLTPILKPSQMKYKSRVPKKSPAIVASDLSGPPNLSLDNQSFCGLIRLGPSATASYQPEVAAASSTHFPARQVEDMLLWVERAAEETTERQFTREEFNNKLHRNGEEDIELNHIL